MKHKRSQHQNKTTQKKQQTSRKMEATDSWLST